MLRIVLGVRKYHKPMVHTGEILVAHASVRKCTLKPTAGVVHLSGREIPRDNRLMATQFDPSWLPSTVAQSTAALVAIVGGFMVSRFVSIDSEMSGARRRLEEAEERHRVASEQRNQVQAAITRRSARDFLTDDVRIDALIASETLPSAADLLAVEDSALSI
jgi:hypothetical protein